MQFGFLCEYVSRLLYMKVSCVCINRDICRRFYSVLLKERLHRPPLSFRKVSTRIVHLSLHDWWDSPMKKYIPGISSLGVFRFPFPRLGQCLPESLVSPESAASWPLSLGRCRSCARLFVHVVPVAVGSSENSLVFVAVLSALLCPGPRPRLLESPFCLAV